MSGNRLTFEQGYIYAAAELVRLHGASVEAGDLVRNAGAVDWSSIASADKEALVAAGILKNKCLDCGKFVERERWTVERDRNPLCLDCASLYDDPRFM